MILEIYAHITWKNLQTYIYKVSFERLDFISVVQIFLFDPNSFIGPQLNCFNFCYQTLVILFNIIYSFAQSEMLSSIAIYEFAHS